AAVVVTGGSAAVPGRATAAVLTRRTCAVVPGTQEPPRTRRQQHHARPDRNEPAGSHSCAGRGAARVERLGALLQLPADRRTGNLPIGLTHAIGEGDGQGQLPRRDLGAACVLGETGARAVY